MKLYDSQPLNVFPTMSNSINGHSVRQNPESLVSLSSQILFKVCLLYVKVSKDFLNYSYYIFCVNLIASKNNQIPNENVK